MTVPLASLPLDSFDLLQQAAIAFRLNHSQRPSAIEIIAALLTLEKAAKAQRIRFPFSALAGQWRLYYTTGVRKRKQGGITLRNGFLERVLSSRLSCKPWVNVLRLLKSQPQVQ